MWVFNELIGVTSSAILKRLGGLFGRVLPAFGGTAEFPFLEYKIQATE